MQTLLVNAAARRAAEPLVLSLCQQATAAAAAAASHSSNSCSVRCFAKAALRHLDLVQSHAGDSWPSLSSSNSASSSAAGSDSSAAHAAGGRGQHAPRQPWSHELHSQGQLQRWQSLAQLSAEDARRLLLQHPSMLARLRCSSGLQPSSYYVNVACLGLHPLQLLHEEYGALRGLLALMPPSVLQAMLEQQPQHRAALQGRQGQCQHAGALAGLQDWLLSALGPVRQRAWPARVQGMQQHGDGRDALHTQQAGCQVSQQQQHLGRPAPCSSDRFDQLAVEVVTALGLHPDQHPAGELEAVLSRAVSRLASSSAPVMGPSSSSSSSSSGGSSSSSSSGGAPRGYATSPAAVTHASGLACALKVTARANHLKHKPVHDGRAAAELVMQLQQVAGLDSSQVLRLLVSRPSLLWQHKSPMPPSQLQSSLQRRLPGLGQSDKLCRLLLKQPRLLARSDADLQAVVDLLATRLQLDPAEAAALVLRHPQLLVQPVEQMLPNIGFLVGVGLTSGDLRAMLLGEPKWLTRPLRDLMQQWRFLEQVVFKPSIDFTQDVVLFPQLLTLSITSRLGPRVLFARKRNIKLLAPQVVCGLRAAWGDRMQLKTVPLDAWLSVSDRRMCSMMGLSLDDFARFKQAWGQVDGANWQRSRRADRQGG